MHWIGHHNGFRSSSELLSIQYNESVINKLSRRNMLRAALCAPMLSLRAARATDVRVQDVQFDFEEFRYRAPYKFGGVEVDRATILNVHCIVKNAAGKTARGFGSMPLGNIWSYPSKTMSYDTTLGAMKALAGQIAAATNSCKDSGHPIDLNHILEPEYLKAATAVSRERKLQEPIPKLCTLVTASPFDAAIHDGFGKLHGRNSFQTYGPDLMSHDLSYYLGPEFKGEYLDRYIAKIPKASMPMYHSVGASDPILAEDIKKRIGDGLPEDLPEWIEYNGLTNIKIKLNGDDLKWDVDRIVRIERAAAEVQARRQVARWVYSLDFNERCPNVAYLLDFIRQLKAQSPAAFGRIQYIEQPTKRDLENDRANVMHEAAKLLPVVIDESLTGQDRMMLAREMGYTGAALKACKGQSQAMLIAAVGRKYKMFLCVQDLTCPGASLIHSAALAAHVPGVAGIEANARQYMPAANKPWEKKFPGIFIVKDGQMKTGTLTGPGLGVL
jgi:L-alanine-DL-glutamate epimerase-like enolase superfamily enzyme